MGGRRRFIVMIMSRGGPRDLLGLGLRLLRGVERSSERRVGLEPSTGRGKGGVGRCVQRGFGGMLLGEDSSPLTLRPNLPVATVESGPSS